MDLHDLPSVMTIAQVADFLRIDQRTALEAAHTGELPVIQLAPQILVDTRSLLAELGVRIEEVVLHDRPGLEVVS